MQKPNMTHEMHDTDEEIHSLPSFPDSPMNKGFSQSVIKDAVETPDNEDLPALPAFAEEKPAAQPKLVEMDQEWKPQQHMPQAAAPLPPPTAQPPGVTNVNKPVFVRIDKFKNARESLDIVKSKLGEIDDLLRTIREVKVKEDQELSSWEKEIESVKTRIDTVTTNIFDNAVN